MILTGPEILEQHKIGRIRIDPFHPDQLSPNSYDFRLGDVLELYEREELDSRADNPTKQITIPDNGMVLDTGRVYLAQTQEEIGSDCFVPMIHARSSVARMGLFIHVTCDLIEMGSYDRSILQLHAVQPVRIFKGMRIGQVTFWSVAGKSPGR
jgi:dCTP deaminase